MNLHLSDRLFDYVCLFWGWRATLDELKAFKAWKKKHRRKMLKSRRPVDKLRRIKEFLTERWLP